jgi:hypothetical protein
MGERFMGCGRDQIKTKDFSQRARRAQSLKGAKTSDLTIMYFLPWRSPRTLREILMPLLPVKVRPCPSPRVESVRLKAAT